MLDDRAAPVRSNRNACVIATRTIRMIAPVRALCVDPDRTKDAGDLSSRPIPLRRNLAGHSSRGGRTPNTRGHERPTYAIPCRFRRSRKLMQDVTEKIAASYTYARVLRDTWRRFDE